MNVTTPFRNNFPQADTSNTQRGNTMNAFVFATWMAYTFITAVWLGDNGWTPIVGIPWLLIVFGYFGYVLRQDFNHRNR